MESELMSHLTLPSTSPARTLAEATWLSVASANKQLDHPYGMCWPRPQAELAVLVGALPLVLVEKWSVDSSSRAWGPAHAPRQCPDYTNHGPCTWSGCRVRLYADGIQRGGAFPPIAVIYRPDNPDKVYGPWLVDDGMHRISALKLLGHQSIAAFVASDSLETLQEALLVAQSLNPASIELG